MKVLSHEKLGVTFQELGAALGTYTMLANNVVMYERDHNCPIEPGEHVFNMAHPGKAFSNCGSIGCIGGTMGMLMGKGQKSMYGGSTLSFDHYIHEARSEALDALFFPPRRYDYEKITIAKTMKVMELWFATGKVQWGKVLGNTCLG